MTIADLPLLFSYVPGLYKISDEILVNTVDREIPPWQPLHPTFLLGFSTYSSLPHATATFHLRAFSTTVTDKPSVCTADELHYVSLSNSDWKLALWNYNPSLLVIAACCAAIGILEKAIVSSDLGMTPNNDGELIRLSIPQLTSERRKIFSSSTDAVVSRWFRPCPGVPPDVRRSLAGVWAVRWTKKRGFPHCEFHRHLRQPSLFQPPRVVFTEGWSIFSFFSGMNVEYMDDVVFGLDLVIVMEEERGEQSDKGSDRTKKLVFRHYCRSKMIGVLNERLTIEQKGYIEKSVFGWLLYLPSSIKIGLPVVGEAIDLNKVGHRSVCREYFPEGKVDVRMFLVPNRSGVVFPIIFDLVSEFGSVAKYNWGSLVFQYFVESVCGASTTMKNETTKSHIHVQGCAYLLQVVIDVGVSKEELCYGMVKDACEKFGIPFKKQNRGDKEKLLFVVEEQTRVIADMQSSINDLRKLVEAKDEDKNEEFVEEPLWGSEDGCQSTPVQHDQQTPVVERGFQMQQSTMYDRMKAQPRIRVKSVVKRSPYTAGVRRKK
ncbi:Ribosome-recycling factor [Vigna angularis]|uniref:Ribosome-recycling factor n=1 Tax=Phaseolus angularis TaxID=3914 RepID=A0A8T0K775_PHAAN|nr:Ribosome-recycling factor [Vigna angularis]